MWISIQSFSQKPNLPTHRRFGSRIRCICFNTLLTLRYSCGICSPINTASPGIVKTGSWECRHSVRAGDAVVGGGGGGGGGRSVGGGISHPIAAAANSSNRHIGSKPANKFNSKSTCQQLFDRTASRGGMYSLRLPSRAVGVRTSNLSVCRATHTNRRTVKLMFRIQLEPVE